MYYCIVSHESKIQREYNVLNPLTPKSAIWHKNKSLLAKYWVNCIKFEHQTDLSEICTLKA